MQSVISSTEVAKMIDHSLLHPTMTDAQVREGLELSRRYNVATACVKPYSVAMAREMLAGSSVGVCAVIGFPHGNNVTAIKVAEAQQCMADGASEIDMVVNNGNVLGGDWACVEKEIYTINQAVVANKAILKVIFENDYLGDDEIIHLCRICSDIRVAFVKTSSGYGFVKQPDGNYNYKGATEHHLRLMRKHSHPSVQIKAAGGVRTLNDLIKVRELGCTRVGATATAAMVEEARRIELGQPAAAVTASTVAGY